MQKAMLILVSSEAKSNAKAATGNNNKFYYIELDDNGNLTSKYGRVGTKGLSKVDKNQTLSDFNSLLKAKLKRGYVQTEIDLETKDDEINISTNSNSDIMDIALNQIKHDEYSKELIKKLVNANIHNITSNTKITFNLKTGIFKTPLGIVTKQGVEKAKTILDKLSLLVNENGLLPTTKEKEIRELSEAYFTIIPTTLPNLRDLSSLLVNSKKLELQNDICDTLITSIDLIESEKNKAKKDNNVTTETLFQTSLTLLNDSKEFDRIVKYFEDSKNKQHGYRTSNSKIKRIFNLNIKKDDDAFRSDMNNIKECWHGTKTVNLLSILKSSLLMPKYSPGSVTGYMYGQGLYFALQSSKSLNYCDGMYWNNQKSKDNLIYMFVADIAMGNYQIPKSSTSRNPDSGYDSYWAKSGQSGVLNDEIIIFKNEQIKLKYLLEIEIN